MSEPSPQLNQYKLMIETVKLKVKFPCRMKIQHSSNPITQQVESQDQSKFVFNKQITIKEEPNKESFDLNIILVTQKGSRYVSGILKLYHNQLVKSQGQKIRCELSKCLDTEAYCELKVEQVKGNKVERKAPDQIKGVDQNGLNTGEIKDQCTQLKPTNKLSPSNKKQVVIQTRSQIGRKLGNIRTANDWQQSRSKGIAETLIYKSSLLRSPKSKQTVLSPGCRLQSVKNSNRQIQGKEPTIRGTYTQRELYREGYEKLKQKYRRESQLLKQEQSKRMQLQTSENNLKIEVMRLKVRLEEMQRAIGQKNDKINLLEVKISQMSKQELDAVYLKEENLNLQQKILQLNHLVESQTKQIQHLQHNNLQHNQQNALIINQLRNELQTKAKKYEDYVKKSEKQLTEKNERILEMEKQNRMKQKEIQFQYNEISKLQSQMQSQLLQFDKATQQLKVKHSQQQDRLKLQIQNMKRQYKQQQQLVKQLKEDKEKLKLIVLKAQYDKKVLLQEQRQMKNFMIEVKSLKEKMIDKERELQLAKQQNEELKKQLLLLEQSKSLNLQQLKQCYQLKITHYQKLLTQLQAKNKSLSIYKLQLQSKIDSLTSIIEKQKKSIQHLGLQNTHLKTTLKDLRQYTSQLQQQIQTKQNQLTLSQNKLKQGQNTTKQEQQTLKLQLVKYKAHITSLQTKHQQLLQTQSNTVNQLNKAILNIKQQEDKFLKLQSTNKQLQSTIQTQNKEHQTLTAQLNQQINRLIQEHKKAQQQIKQSQLTNFKLKTQLDKQKIQLKLSQQRKDQLQSLLNNKSTQIAKSKQQLHSLAQSLKLLQLENNTLKNNHILLEKDKQKQFKITELKSQQILNLKQQHKHLINQIHQSSLNQNNLRQQIKSINQNLSNQQIKYKSISKQYARFKQEITKNIVIQFAKLPLITSIVYKEKQISGKNQSYLVTSRVNHSNVTCSNLPTQRTKKSIQECKTTVPLRTQLKDHTVIFPSQISKQPLTPSSILSHLSQSITNNKDTLLSLIEHNRQLKRQVEELKEENQQSKSKHQFNEMQLHRSIFQVEEQLAQVYERKQVQISNCDQIVCDLNQKLHQKQLLIDQLTLQIQRLQHTISQMKLDFQNDSILNNNKANVLQNIIKEHERNLQYYKLMLSNQQDRTHQLEGEAQTLKTQLQELNSIRTKLTINIQSLQSQNETLQTESQSQTKQRKSLIERITQLQIQLNEQQASKQTISFLLSQQEKKNNQHKLFINQLIKQKQTIVKSQLEKTQSILELQDKLIEMKRELEVYQDEKIIVNKQLQSVKENLRKESSEKKTLYNQLEQLKKKSLKVEEKLQQKHKQLQLKDEIISKVQTKYKQLTDKHYKDTLQLNAQIDAKYKQNVNISKQMAQTIVQLESKIQQLEMTKAKNHSQILTLSDQLLVCKQSVQLHKRQQTKIETQLSELNKELQQERSVNRQLREQLQRSEQQLSMLNQQLIFKQDQLQTLHTQHQASLRSLHQQYSDKISTIQKQHQLNLQQIKTEYKMLSKQLSQKTYQLQFASQLSKTTQTNSQDIRNNYQVRIKQLQHDRTTLVISKNQQINNIKQQNDTLMHKHKLLQTQLKNALQTISATNKKLSSQQKNHQDLQHKLSSLNLLYQSQTANLKLKSSQYQTLKQLLHQSFWTIEREIKKIILNHNKILIELTHNAQKDNIIIVCKTLQQQLLNSLKNTLQPVLNQ